jgi:CBS domain-containing protein
VSQVCDTAPSKASYAFQPERAAGGQDSGRSTNGGQQTAGEVIMSNEPWAEGTAMTGVESVSALEFTAEALLQRIDARVADGAQLADIRELLYSDNGWLQTDFGSDDEREWFHTTCFARLRRCLLWAEFNAPWHAKSVTYTVGDAMTTDVISTTPASEIDTVQSLLLKHEISGMPVVDDAGRLVGIVSECDILKLYSLNGGHVQFVGDCMKSSGLITVHSGELLTTVTQIFCNHPYRRLPVVRDGIVVGVLSRRDILQFVDDLDIGQTGELVFNPS